MSEDKLVFSHNEVFKTDPNNKDKVIMRIPNDIMKKQGWAEGTKVKIKVGDQGTIIIENVEGEEDGK